MNPYIEELKRQLTENPPRVGDGNPILTMLYESYSDANRMDDDRIKTDFHELYQAMNGMLLREMDRITDSVCTIGAFNAILAIRSNNVCIPADFWRILLYLVHLDIAVSGLS